MKTYDRQPAVAGTFYPAQPEILQQELKHLFESSAPKKYNQVRAIICPHAGYIYSGRIAASAFNQIDSEISYKRIIIIASSHREYFNNASVYCDGNYAMPYGTEIVDTAFCKRLVERYPETFTAKDSPHLNEHSVEVQLPFLHYALKTSYKIIPIIIGTNNPDVCKRIATALKPYLNAETLFIISTDFSHYPEYSDAKKVDEITKEAIISNNPQTLLTTLAKNAEKHFPNLTTSLCGWTSVLTLLYMTSQKDSFEYHAIEYCNSGDSTNFGESTRVVGYWGIAISEKQIQKNDFLISETDKKTLLQIARKTIEEYCKYGKKYEIDTSSFSNTLNIGCGVFVSLHKKGTLRGCIGLVSSELPLYNSVQEMAISAALNDNRFRPVEVDELIDIDIEISVLSPLKKIDDIAEITLGKHGIFIEKEQHTGLFLPQVAAGTGWDKEEFLGHCAMDKAHLGWNGWRTANIYVFTATVFSEYEN